MALLPEVPPLRKTGDEVSAFIQELLGPPEEVGYYRRTLSIRVDCGGALEVEAEWLGHDVDSLRIDDAGNEAFSAPRVWRLPISELPL